MKRLLLVLLFTASIAHAEIFTWTDNRGTVHYTNSEYEIPGKYRAKAKILNLGIVEKKDNSSPQQDATSQQIAPPQQREQQNQAVKPAQPPAYQRPAGNPMSDHAAKRMRAGGPPAE